MSQQYTFGDYVLNGATRELTKCGDPLAVEPQVFDVILHLVEHRDRIVSKDELVEAIWDGRAVSDTAIASRINFARGTLDDDGKSQKVIRTFPRKGFRFVAECNETTTAHEGSAKPIVERPSIAILPFANLSAKPEDEIIGEGICEDLTAGLSAVRLYRIISRSSTSRYKESGPDLALISSELGAAYAVTGSFRRLGDRIRISVQLDDVDRGVQVWARRFEGDYSALFDMQDEVVSALIGQLEPELDHLGFQRTKRSPVNQMTAWELYHRATILVSERKMETTLLARDYFKRAIEIDPDFYRAYAGLSQVYAHMGVTTGEYLDGEEMVRTARIAVAGDSRDYLSQTALGIALNFRGDLAGSLKAHEQAIKLNPHNASSRGWYASTLISAGHVDEAIIQLELAIKLSPNDPWIGPFYGRLSRAHYYAGNLDQSVAAAEASFNHPHHWPVHACYTACMVRLGRVGDIEDAYKGLLGKMPDITAEFIRQHLPDRPYLEMLIDDLKEAGLS